MNIITLTMNPALDMSCTTDEVAPNRKLRCGPPRFDPGGGGINVSAVIHELGCESTAVFPFGGPAGEQLVELVNGRSIRCRPVEIGQPTRTNLSVRDESTGKQFRFVMPGAELSEDEIDACLDALWNNGPPPDLLAVSGSFPPGVLPDFMTRLAEETHRRNIRLAVDASGEPLRKAAEAGVFLLKPNEQELADLTNTDPDADEEPDRALSQLMEQNDCENIVLSLGGGGAVLASRDGIEQRSAPEVDVKSRTGAGDSMVGGILTGLCREYDLRDAVRLGVAAGSAAVQTEGTELCRREDVDALFKAD